MEMGVLEQGMQGVKRKGIVIKEKYMVSILTSENFCDFP